MWQLEEHHQDICCNLVNDCWCNCEPAHPVAWNCIHSNAFLAISCLNPQCNTWCKDGWPSVEVGNGRHVLMETNMALFSSLGLWTMALMGRRCDSYCLLLFHTSTSSCILHHSFHGSCHRKIWLATVNEWNTFSFNTAPVSFKIIHFFHSFMATTSFFIIFHHGNCFILCFIVRAGKMIM